MKKQRGGRVLVAACALALTLGGGLFWGFKPAVAGAEEPARVTVSGASSAPAAGSTAGDASSALANNAAGVSASASTSAAVSASADDTATENVYLLDFSAPELGSWDAPGGQYQVELGSTIRDALDALNMSDAYQYGVVLDAADFGGNPNAHYQFQGWGAISAATGQYMSLDTPLQASDFTKSGSAYVLNVEMMLSSYRPYTFQNGVLTFDDDPDTEYYQLTVDMGNGITWGDVMRPGAADKQQDYLFAWDFDIAWSGDITQSLFVRKGATDVELGVVLNSEAGNQFYIYPSDSVKLHETTGDVAYVFAVDSMTGPGSVRVTATDESAESEVAEPFDEDGNLLPYTVADGVMTFDDHPELGEWYQLEVKLPKGTSVETVASGTPWTMTIPAYLLDKDDPLYSSSQNATVFFVRGDNRGAASSLLVSYPSNKALSWTFSKNSGTVKRVPGGSVFDVTLNEPATLSFALKGSTVVANSDGNSISHVAGPVTSGDDTYSDDDVWSSLSLVTKWLGGSKATEAGNAMNAAIKGIKQMFVYDIHLEGPDGKEFKLSGDKVTVTLQIPDELRGKSGLHVYHVADDGTVTDMHATVDQKAGTLTFTTAHFSTFVIAQVDEGKTSTEPTTTTPQQQVTDATKDSETDGGDLVQTGDASLTMIGVALAGAAVAFGAAAVVRRKHSA